MTYINQLCRVLSTFLLGQLISVNGLMTHNFDKHVYYGKDASIKEFPYFASLNGCGAGILSDRWIVTAAHCLVPPLPTPGKRIWFGGERIDNSKVVEYDRVIIHPKYTPHPVILHDIALLRLVTPLTFNDKVKPLKLPTQNSMKNPNLSFVGRGNDETNRETISIKKVDLTRLTGEKCLSYMSKSQQRAVKPHLRLLEKAIICTKRSDNLPGVCHGDSGGPLTQGNTLIGIASFVIDKCHKTNLGFFTNVASYVPWIKKNTGL